MLTETTRELWQTSFYGPLSSITTLSAFADDDIVMRPLVSWNRFWVLLVPNSWQIFAVGALFGRGGVGSRGTSGNRWRELEDRDFSHQCWFKQLKHCYFPMPERRLFERSRMQERQCCKENTVLDPQLFFQIRKNATVLVLFSPHSDCGKYINFRCCSNTNGVSCMAIPKAIFKFTSTAKNGLC